MLDEQSLKDIALRTPAAEADAAKTKAATRASAASAALDGRRVELDQLTEKHQRFGQQRARRAGEGIKEKAALVLDTYSKGKSSTETAAAAYGRIVNEDAFLHDLLKHSRSQIDAGRQRLHLAEIDAMRADLDYREAEVVTLAIAHQAAAQHLIETDDSFKELPYGEKLTAALDFIATLTVRLAEQQRMN